VSEDDVATLKAAGCTSRKASELIDELKSASGRSSLAFDADEILVAAMSDMVAQGASAAEVVKLAAAALCVDE
jgi:hypothetical protein